MAQFEEQQGFSQFVGLEQELFCRVGVVVLMGEHSHQDLLKDGLVHLRGHPLKYLLEVLARQVISILHQGIQHLCPGSTLHRTGLLHKA